ncbi:MAG: hypothetical protein JNK05_12540 [Myxococcales bacterium]|nr:hypothetical protein [Myxococcales bacterium]
MIDTDLSIPAETQELRVAVSPDMDGAVPQDEPFVVAGRADQGCREEGRRHCLPLSFVITERAGRPAGSLVRVRVSALAPGTSDTVVLERRALLAFQPGRSLAFNMFLPKACGNGGVAYCATRGLVCTERGCEPERVSSDRLVPFVPGTERMVSNGPDASLHFDASDAPDAVTTDIATDAERDVRDASDVSSDASDANDIVDVASDGGSGCPGGRCPTLDLAVGYDHTCVRRRSNGEVLCWGDNQSGQLGRGFATAPRDGGGGTGIAAPAPIASPMADAGAPLRFAGITVGRGTTCGFTAGDEVYCWGYTSGTLNTEEPGLIVTRPSRVRGVTAPSSARITALSTVNGAYFIHWSNGEVHSFGTRFDGAVADGADMPAVRFPSEGAIAALANARVQVSFRNAGFAVTPSGGVLVWGGVQSARFGRLMGDPPDSAVQLILRPTALPTVTNASSIAVEHASVCALLANGSISCWGSNEGHLVDAVAGTDVSLPDPQIHPAFGSGNTAVAMVGPTVFSISDTGAIRCAGASYTRTCISAGTDRARSTVSGFTGPTPFFVSIGGGFDQLCALTNDDRVFCWGGNRWSQCGAPESDLVDPSAVHLVAIP